MADGLQGSDGPERHVPGQLHQTHVDEHDHDQQLIRELKGHQLPYTLDPTAFGTIHFMQRNKGGTTRRLFVKSPHFITCFTSESLTIHTFSLFYMSNSHM